MADDTTTIELSDGVQTVPEALAALADCINVLAGEEKARSAATQPPHSPPQSLLALLGK